MSKLSVEQPRDDAALFHLLVESVQDYAIFALDEDGRVVSWNRGAQQIKGYPADEVIGRHFSLFFTAEDRAADRPGRLLAAAREHGRTEVEGWRVRRDGRRFWANVVITALRDSDGTLIGFAKITRDLTERRAAEQQARQRQQQLSDTQALAGLGTWQWDVTSDRVTWSDELYRIYGLEPQSFGATFDAYLARVHPEDRERVRSLVEAALREDIAFDFVERIIRPDGSVRFLRSRGRAERNEAGEATRMLGACLDITELRRAEEQSVQLAREQAAREAAEAAAEGMRFLVQASEVLSSSLDYEATLSNVASLAAPARADWCAVDLLELDGRLKRVAVAHRDPAKVELAMRVLERYPPPRDARQGTWHVIESGEAEYYPSIPDELLAAGAQDEEHLGLMRELGLSSAVIVPLAGRARPLGTLTLVQAESGRVLTENDVWIARELGRHAALAIENARLHRELELQNSQLEEQSLELETQAEELNAQALQQEQLMEDLERANLALQERTREAEEANRVKSEFLAAMSHELRTPLNAIFGYADLLQMELHGPITPPQHDALERIKRNQRALLVLVNDVLNFAKLEAGRLEINLAEVALRVVFADLEEILTPQLRGHGLRYESRIDDAELVVRGEHERIEQILLNLLTNAIKFTPSGGTISLSAEGDGPVVRLRVRDTGCGIPADRLEAIFDPFVQIVRQPEDPERRGVGLGLAISRDLARAMNGTLTVESEPGVGSVFTLTLPRADSR